MRLTGIALALSFAVGMAWMLPAYDRITAQAEGRTRLQLVPEPFWIGDPASLAIDRHDHIFLAAGDIFEYSTRGKLLAHWKQPANANGVTVGNNNVVYAAEGSGVEDDQVLKLSASGKTLATWGNRGLNQPWGLAIDAGGQITVSDAGHNRIVVLSRKGKVVTTWSTVASQPGQLNDPLGVIEDGAGNLIVADAGNGRVLKFSPTGTLLGNWSPAHLFAFPEGVAVDRANNVYVTDGITMHVTKLSPTGDVLATWGSPGTNPGELAQPEGIAIDSHGNIYVADYGTRRIQKFSPTGEVLAVWGGTTPSARAARSVSLGNNPDREGVS
jgi:DNA-binding beta-propeller fold protein YncE